MVGKSIMTNVLLFERRNLLAFQGACLTVVDGFVQAAQGFRNRSKRFHQLAEA